MPSDVAAGDLTGDGIADIVVGTYPVYGPDGGRVHVLDGPLAPEQSLATARATLTMPEIGGRVELGDFDGDGALEIVHPAGPVWVAPGSVVGPSDIATVAIAELGDQVWGVGVGDLNLDGRADVIVGEEQSVLPGRAYVVHGGLSGAVSFDQADLTLQSDDPGFGHSAAPIGDVNADGFEDFAVGSWRNSTAGTDAGAVWIMFGPHL